MKTVVSISKPYGPVLNKMFKLFSHLLKNSQNGKRQKYRTESIFGLMELGHLRGKMALKPFEMLCKQIGHAINY